MSGADFQLARIAGILADIRGFLLIITIMLACILLCVCDIAKVPVPTTAPKQGATHG